MSFNGEFPYICESWYLLCPNITKTSLILVHLYSLFFNVFRFFQFLFQRVQTCSNMFWFWRCLSVRRHPGVVSCSNIGIWYSKKHNKNRLHVVLSHIRCLKKEGIFFSNHHASLSIFLHLYTTQLKHTYLLNTKQLSTLLSNFITVDLLLLCHEKWFKSLCPRVCSNPNMVINSVTMPIVTNSNTKMEVSHAVGVHNYTKVQFASFLSGWFITALVVNPPERKLAKCTSVNCWVLYSGVSNSRTLWVYLFPVRILPCAFISPVLISIMTALYVHYFWKKYPAMCAYSLLCDY